MITLVGKQNLSGVSSKTNRPYNFNIIHVVDDTQLKGLDGSSVHTYNCTDDFYLQFEVGTVFKYLYFDASKNVAFGVV